MTIEMRTTFLRVPLRRFSELPIGPGVDLENREAMYLHVYTPDGDFLSVTGISRRKHVTLLGESAYRGDINSVRIPTRLPGVEKQFRWTKDK